MADPTPPVQIGQLRYSQCAHHSTEARVTWRVACKQEEEAGQARVENTSAAAGVGASASTQLYPLIHGAQAARVNKLLAGIGLCAAPDSCQSPKRVSSIDQAGVPPARAGQARSRSCRLLKQPRQRSEDWAGRREAAGCGERACRRKVHAYPARGAHGSDAAGQGGLHCDLVRGLGKGTRNGERKGELAGFVGPEGRARFASGSRPRWRSRSADGPDPADFGPKIARWARWMGRGLHSPPACRPAATATAAAATAAPATAL